MNRGPFQSGLRWRIRLVYCASKASLSRNPFPVGVPVMRFSILIPAVAVLGLAGCQVPAPTTAGANSDGRNRSRPRRHARPRPDPRPAPPTAPAVAEVERSKPFRIEEAEPADAAPTADRANASTEQAKTAAPEQADELAAEDEPADSQMADTTAESSETAAMSPSPEASEVPEVEDAAVSGVSRPIHPAPNAEDATERKSR